MRIAVCDDNELQLAEATRVLEGFAERRGLDLVAVPFQTTDDLFSDGAPWCFDVVFMDIEFAGKPLGIDAAQRINEIAPNCQVVYLTDYLQYSVDVYRTNHVWFIVKAQLEDRLPEVFEKLARIAEVRNSIIVVKTVDGSIMKIPCEDILFLERRKRITRIVTLWGECTIRENLNDILEKLPALAFAYCHNSIVANMPQIQEMHATELVFENGQRAPVSRRYAKRFRDRYFDWAEQWMV